MGKQKAITIVWVEMMVYSVRTVAVQTILNLIINICWLFLKHPQKENCIIDQFPLNINSDEESKHDSYIKYRFLISQALCPSFL